MMMTSNSHVFIHEKNGTSQEESSEEEHVFSTKL